IRNRFDSVVIVPTVDRELAAPRRCCSATAGGRPVISCTCGAPTCWSNRRAYGATDSKYRRCASAYNVPNASDDFPDPEIPVKTTSASRGTSTSTLRRLCSLAPRTCTKRSSGSWLTLSPYPIAAAAPHGVTPGVPCGHAPLREDPADRAGALRGTAGRRLHLRTSPPGHGHGVRRPQRMR